MSEPVDDPKPTLAELRMLRIAKLSPPTESIVPIKHVLDYSKMTVVELKNHCKESGKKGFTGKCKQELIAMLTQ